MYDKLYVVHYQGSVRLARSSCVPSLFERGVTGGTSLIQRWVAVPVALKADMTTLMAKSHPFLSFMRVVYLHFVLLFALFGTSEGTTTTSRTRGGCPLTRFQLAFQAPFNSLSAALHGSAASNPISRRSGAGSSFSDSDVPSPPRWVTEGSVSPRVLRSRKVDVLPLSMSAVETAQGTKRAAVDEPDDKQKKAEKKAKRMAASSSPLGVHVVGLSHHNAGVDIREKLAVPEAEWNDASAKVRVLLCGVGGGGLVLLSCC